MLEKIDAISYLDIIDDLVDTISYWGYGKYELSQFLKVVGEDNIEQALEMAHFKFHKIDKGTYKIEKEEIPDHIRDQVIKYVEECIQIKGFNEEGECMIDAIGKFELNPVSIIQIIRDMGYIGVMDSTLEIFILRHPDYQDL